MLRERHQSPLDWESLYNQYRTLLLKGIVPFWLSRGIDWEYGGVLTCMAEDGAPISGDKFIWSQARSIWTFSAIHNRIERNPLLLDVAANSVRFLLAHCRDDKGRWVYHTTREGDILEGAISIYSDCFVVYGLTEYCRAVPDASLRALACSTLDQIQVRIESPDFSDTAPYKLPPGRRAHAIPMILTEITNELAQLTADPVLESRLDGYVSQIMDRFVRPERRLLLEYLSDRYEELPPPDGTIVVPGHAIECMWFVLHAARRRNSRQLIRRAADQLRWHLDAGWDKEYGGLFLSIDAEGREPSQPHWDKKLWWPHTEALYALLLAYEMTGEEWCLEWYRRVHEWAFSHFSMGEVGEWRQRLDRKGQPIADVVALPVKDPFHLPRAAILILQALVRMGYSS